ncbi:unnamed protein product [Sphagnum jensenii]|uniref:F-box/LRR-repeat protein 15-like leucin rich repeat domain-containing protein n=1 Tax=Sphagnum jensenii TaxID=128206 RepID=A0ABP1A338_9BRYO
MCGRGLSDQCLTATFATRPGALSSLTLVALRGAYCLTDKGVSALLQAAPCLTSVNLSQCSLLTEEAVKAVADCLGTQLCALSLEGCAQMDGLKLLPILLQMPCLKKLLLSGVGGVKDEVVSELAVVLGSTLEELHLADCRLLTNAAVVGVAACCLGLKVLDLDMLPLLSDMAISCLADGCRSLRVLSLKRAKLSDEAVAAFITASGSSLCEISLNSVQQAGDNTLVALAKHSRMSLEVLDMSWCRSVTDHGLGFVADSCPLLRELRLFGCTQVCGFCLFVYLILSWCELMKVMSGNKILYGWALKLLIGGDWIWAGEYNFSWTLVKLWFVTVSSINAAVVVGSFMGYTSEIVCVSLSKIVGAIKHRTHANFPFVLKLPMN